MTPLHTLPVDIQWLVYCLFACVFGELMFIGLWRVRCDELQRMINELRKAAGRGGR